MSNYFNLYNDFQGKELFDPNSQNTGSGWMTFFRKKNGQVSITSSTCSTVSEKSIEETVPTDKSIEILCDSMKKQIVSRAFRGWLSHTRHLQTIRTHLSKLVHPIALNPNDYPEEETLSSEVWKSFHDEDGSISPHHERRINLLLYFGGCEHSIRKEVWPYLLSHHSFGMTAIQRKDRDSDIKTHYEMTIGEWLAVEAIVVQRDKELLAANLAKYSSESTTSSDVPTTSATTTKPGSNMSNDVFTDDDEGSDDLSSSETTERNSRKTSEDTITSGKNAPIARKNHYVTESCTGDRREKLDSDDSEVYRNQKENDKNGSIYSVSIFAHTIAVSFLIYFS